MNRTCLRAPAVAFGLLGLASLSSSAETLFSDDFSEPNGTSLVGKAPDVGQPWTQPVGPALTVQSGAINTTGAAREAFAQFTKVFDGSTRLLKLTADFTVLSHNGGFAGISLFNGTQEQIFFGDPSGAGASAGFTSGGQTVRANPVTTQGVLSLVYDYQTGRISMFAGDTASGSSLGTLLAAPNLQFDRLRVANNNGGDVALSSITVDTLSQPAPVVDLFTATPQIQLVDFGTELAWETSYADSVSISPQPGPVPANGFELLFPQPGDVTYTITATDTGSGTSATRQVATRTVAGGRANYRYLRFTTVKTRGNPGWVQLSEMYFYHQGGTVQPVAVTNPGGNNPGPAEDAPKVIDGNGTTKWLDFNAAPLVFDFGAPTAVDSYSFTTGNDAPERDPVRWLIEGSNDGATWQLVDNVTAFDFAGTLNRNASPGIVPLPGVSLLPFASLTGNATVLVSGDTLTLNYRTIDAATVTLNNGSGNQTLTPGTGTLQLSPTASTTYTLTATNAAGKVSTAKISVQVINPAVTSINYPNFNNAGSELALIGTATILNDFANRPLPGDFKRLRLTEAINNSNGVAWFRKRQKVGSGFETNFGMHITRKDGGNGADGMAFIIQNSAAGSDLVVTNAENGQAANALTIGFDAYQNGGEPSAAMLRVASAGNVLALVDLATYPGLTLRSAGRLLDPTGNAAPYQVRIVYSGGLLNVWLDGVQILNNLAVDLAALNAVDAAGTAIVGFAARTGGSSEAHDVTSWTLTTGTAAPALRIISSSINKSTGQLSLTWTSEAGRHYRITSSGNLTDWSTVLVEDVVGQAGQTTANTTFTGGPRGFFRVELKP